MEHGDGDSGNSRLGFPVGPSTSGYCPDSLLSTILLYSLVLFLLLPHGFFHMSLRDSLVSGSEKLGLLSVWGAASFSSMHLNDAQWEGFDRRT